MLVTRGHGQDVVSQKKISNIIIPKNGTIFTGTAFLERDIGQVHKVALDG